MHPKRGLISKEEKSHQKCDPINKTHHRKYTEMLKINCLVSYVLNQHCCCYGNSNVVTIEGFYFTISCKIKTLYKGLVL